MIKRDGDRSRSTLISRVICKMHGHELFYAWLFIVVVIVVAVEVGGILLGSAAGVVGGIFATVAEEHGRNHT